MLVRVRVKEGKMVTYGRDGASVRDYKAGDEFDLELVPGVEPSIALQEAVELADDDEPPAVVPPPPAPSPSDPTAKKHDGKHDGKKQGDKKKS